MNLKYNLDNIKKLSQLTKTIESKEHSITKTLGLKYLEKKFFISLSLATQIHRSKESLDFYQPHMEVQIIMEVGLTFHTIEQLI